jgi:hypothetical protein
MIWSIQHPSVPTFYLHPAGIVGPFDCAVWANAIVYSDTIKIESFHCALVDYDAPDTDPKEIAA